MRVRFLLNLALVTAMLAASVMAGPIHVPSRSVLIPDELMVPVRNHGVVRYHLMKVLQIPEGELFFLPTGTAREEWELFDLWPTLDDAAKAALVLKVRKENLERAKLYCDDRGYLRREFFKLALDQHQIDVTRMVKSIYQFGYDMDAQSPIFNKQVPEGIAQDLAGIMQLDSGRSAFAIVSPFDINTIVATVSTAHADKYGKVPLESRLKVDGRPYTLPPVTDEYYLDHSPRPYIYWRNPTRSFPLAEAVFNAYPVVVRKNLRVEIKLYAKDPKDSTPWGVLLARQLLAHNLTRRTNEIVPPRFFPTDDDLGVVLGHYEEGRNRIKPGDYEYEMALRDALFQVIHSKWTRMYVWPEEVVLQEVGTLAKRVYSVYFNIKDHYPETADPDVVGSTVRVGRVARKDFDATLASAAVLARGDDIMDTFFMRLYGTSPYRDSDCSFLLNALAIDFPFAGAERQQAQWYSQKLDEMYAKGVFKKK